MTHTLISMISIFIGLFGAHFLAFIKKEYSMGFTGNTLVGIFGGILLIKSFGRLGFDPVSILASGEINFLLLGINFLVSFLGGVLGLFFAKRITNKMRK